jgi:hypothetical protein
MLVGCGSHFVTHFPDCKQINFKKALMSKRHLLIVDMIGKDPSGKNRAKADRACG